MKIAAQLWAIALLTLREAIRRKTFLVLIFFAIALLSSMTFFSSVDPSARLRLLEMWSLRATVFFAALVAIFLGAFLLPGDFEEKRIQMVATKPVSKSAFLLGRHLGMAITIAIFVSVMGIISFGFLQCVKWIEGDSIPDLRARPIVPAEKLEGLGVVEEYKPDPELRRTMGQVPGTLLWQFRNLPAGATRIEGTISIGNVFFSDQGTARVRFFLTGAPGQSYQEEMVLPANTPFHLNFPGNLIEKGFPLQVAVTPDQGEIWLEAGERSIRIQGQPASQFFARGTWRPLESPPRIRVQGWAKGALTWNFGDLDADQFPETVSGRIRVNITPLRSSFRFTGPTRVVVRTADGTQHVEEEVFTKSNEWTDFSFPRSLIESNRDILVFLIAGDDDMRMAGNPSSCQLFEDDELFVWNFAKGFLLIYCWILLIMTVTMIASSLVSGPVSVLAGVMVLVVGSSYGFITKAVKDVDRSLVRYYEADQKGEKARTPDDIPPWLLEYSRTGSRIALLLFPDSRDFDFSSFLLSDLAVRDSDIGKALQAMIPRLIILLLLGIVVMMRKDFG